MNNFLKQDEKQDIQEYEQLKKLLKVDKSQMTDFHEQSTFHCTCNGQVEKPINVGKCFAEGIRQVEQQQRDDKMKELFSEKNIEKAMQKIKKFEESFKIPGIECPEDLSPRSYFSYPEMVIIDDFKVKDAIKQCENDIKIVEDLKDVFLDNFYNAPKNIDIKDQLEQIEQVKKITNAIYDYYIKFKNFTGPILLLENDCFTGGTIGPAYRTQVRRYLQELQNNNEKFLEKFFIVCFLIAEKERRDYDRMDTYMNFNSLLEFTRINLTNTEKEQYLEQMKKEFQHTTIKYN